MRRPKDLGRIGYLTLLALTVVLSGLAQNQSQQFQIEKAKIFQETYPVITESDLYCSYFMLEDNPPEIRVFAAERQNERILLSDDDVVYINKGKKDGLEVGQLFFLVEVQNRIGDYGFLACRRGRVRLISCEETRSVGRVEKACGQVTVGNFLFPYEEKEGLLGRDVGFEPYGSEGKGPIGRIIFQENDFVQISSGNWAIIDLGQEKGVEVGQQLTVYRRVNQDAPREAVANVIVIDVGQRTATVKVLSAKEAIFKGYEVQAK